MKIKTVEMDYESVMALPRPKQFRHKKPNLFFRTLVRVLAEKDLKNTSFTFTARDMEKVQGKPCLILMNHSSFLDLEIVSKIFYPHPYCIVCTSDGFVGKEWLMRELGCIPTAKFTTDIGLLKSLMVTLNEKKTSVLMYPEASYSFNGCATPLPRRMGVLIKKLGVPVVMIRTYGAYSYDPLYNNLQKRSVKVSAEVYPIFTEEDLQVLDVAKMDERLDRAFSFDHFAWQKENHIIIDEPFRADCLERILYKCPTCRKEKETEGEGKLFRCHACGKEYELTELGELKAKEGDAAFTHIPDWYAWQRREVSKAIQDHKYNMKVPVKIGMMVDRKAIYMVGEGTLTHDETGFKLTGCNGRLHYEQGPMSSYSLYADYYWYEIGDVICIGTKDCLYYCFPTDHTPVAKARLAAEEIYKLCKKKRSKE